MDKDITWVGLDAHKKTIAVAVLVAGHQQVVEEWTAEHTAAGLAKLVRRLAKLGKGTEIRACYEAGPCGFALQRTLEASGKLVCEVIAPSLIPRKPGERIKTDRRDARKLAELLRAGLLTPVRPPSPEQEAMRDVCRCREDAREDVGRARHRLQKMLVRHGPSFTKTLKLWRSVRVARGRIFSSHHGPLRASMPWVRRRRKMKMSRSSCRREGRAKSKKIRVEQIIVEE